MTEKERFDRFEFYETPAPFTRWMFQWMIEHGFRIHGHILEPCVGNGAIIKAFNAMPAEPGLSWESAWSTNDLDPEWPADTHDDAAGPDLWRRHNVSRLGGANDSMIDWTVSNPPFNPAAEILSGALMSSRSGVAMHVRATFNEPLKTPGLRRSLLRTKPPTATLWLPRFSYRKNDAGKWSTDSTTCCWLIWVRNEPRQFVDYAPNWVIDEAVAIMRAREK